MNAPEWLNQAASSNELQVANWQNAVSFSSVGKGKDWNRDDMFSTEMWQVEKNQNFDTVLFLFKK